MAQALALHSSSVSPTEAGVPLLWKGTAVTRRLRSSALSSRTDRVQNPQAPSNMRVRCCGSSVKVTKLIVPLLSGLTGKEATRIAEHLRNYCPMMLAWRSLSRNCCRVSVECEPQMQKSPQRPQIWLEVPRSSVFGSRSGTEADPNKGFQRAPYSHALGEYLRRGSHPSSNVSARLVKK